MPRCGAHSSRRRAREAEVGAKRLAHRVDEALGAARRRSRPPTRGRGPARASPRGRSAARSGRRSGRGTGSAARTSPSAASPVGRRAPTRSRSRTGTRAGRRSQTNGSNGERNATEGGGSGGASSSSTSSRRTKRLPRTPSTSTGTSSPLLDELLAQRGPPRLLRPLRVRLRRADAAEDVGAADAEKAVRAVARQELVPELFPQRHLARERRSAGSSRSIRS